jgi:predicted alpha/beta hydrolase family esterase
MKHQIVFMRGGDCFKNKEQFLNYLKNKDYNPFKPEKTWRDWLEISLSEYFELFCPVMPNKQWIDYETWVIWFEKIFPYLNPSVDSKLILVGQSFGATFLLKYLSENKIPKQIYQLHIVSPILKEDGLVGEAMGTLAFNLERIKQLNNIASKIFLYHSLDDTIVPIENSHLFIKMLPKTLFYEFNDRGHFEQPVFIELLENIYSFIKK